MPINKRTFRSYNPAFSKFTPGQKDRKRSLTLNLGVINGSITRDLFRAPSEVLLDTISVLTTTANAANINSYWKFDIQNVTKGSASVPIQAGKTIVDTSVTGITANTALDIYADSTDPGLYKLASNDVLQLVITKVGFPPNLQDLSVQVDYEISGVTTTTSSSTTTTTTTTTSTSSSTTTSSTTTISTTTTIT